MMPRLRKLVTPSLWGSLCLLIACAFPGCSADPLTELVVVVNSDMTVPDEFDGFRVVIKGNDEQVATDRYFFIGKEAGKTGLPADFGLIPKNGDASRRVNVEIYAQASGADLFSTRAITGFVEGKTLRLDMFLARRCLSEAKACKPNETCRVNGCAPEEVDPRTLPEFDPDPQPSADQWVHTAKSSGSIWWGTAVDQPGNSYTAGSHTTEIVVNGTSYPTVGESTAMIASFDSKGAIRWFKSLPASTMSYASGVATGADRVCVAGWFAGKVQVGAELLDSGAGQNGLILCYDTSGALQWARSFGGSGNVQPKHIAIAPNGDVAVGGLYFRSMTIGDDTLPETTSDDVLIARFDASGNPKDARAFGGSGLDDVVRGVAFDSASNLIVAGTVSAGTLDFGGAPATLQSSKSAFVAKYQPDGALAWVRSFDNGSNQLLSAVDVGPDDRVAIAGGFPGTVDFGGGPLTSTGDLDIGVIVIDAQGNHVASKLFGGSKGEDRALAVRYLSDRILVAGLHSGAMTFGAKPLLSAPDQNGYVVSLTPDLSSVQWAHSLGGTGGDIAHDVEVSGTSVVVAGEFATTLAFGSLSAVSPGGVDGFLLHFRP